jgi:hypothetical protein
MEDMMKTLVPKPGQIVNIETYHLCYSYFEEDQVFTRQYSNLKVIKPESYMKPHQFKTTGGDDIDVHRIPSRVFNMNNVCRIEIVKEA